MAQLSRSYTLAETRWPPLSASVTCASADSSMPVRTALSRLQDRPALALVRNVTSPEAAGSAAHSRP